MAYDLQPLGNDAPLPPLPAISAVFLAALTHGRIPATQNKRDWDIPGGHLVAGEAAMDALRREVHEETGAQFDWAMPFIILATPSSSQVMRFWACL